MKFRLNLFVLLLIILNPIFILSDIGKTNIDIVNGYWTPYFPVSNLRGGYYFKRDGRFYFINEVEFNVKKKYSGSSGKWKLSGSRLYILIENNVIWKSKWQKDDVTGVYYPGQNNSYSLLKNKKRRWIEISNLKLFCKEKSIKNFIKPASLFLRPISSRGVLHSRLVFWKLCDFVKGSDILKCQRVKLWEKLFDKK